MFILRFSVLNFSYSGNYDIRFYRRFNELKRDWFRCGILNRFHYEIYIVSNNELFEERLNRTKKAEEDLFQGLRIAFKFRKFRRYSSSKEREKFAKRLMSMWSSDPKSELYIHHLLQDEIIVKVFSNKIFSSFLKLATEGIEI